MPSLKFNLLLFLSLFCILTAFSQSATVKGVILDDQQQPIEGVSIRAGDNGTVSNENGFYEISISIDENVTVEFTHLSHKRVVVIFSLKNGQVREFNY